MLLEVAFSEGKNKWVLTKESATIFKTKFPAHRRKSYWALETILKPGNFLNWLTCTDIPNKAWLISIHKHAIYITVIYRNPLIFYVAQNYRLLTFSASQHSFFFIIWRKFFFQDWFIILVITFVRNIHERSKSKMSFEKNQDNTFIFTGIVETYKRKGMQINISNTLFYLFIFAHRITIGFVYIFLNIIDHRFKLAKDIWMDIS